MSEKPKKLSTAGGFVAGGLAACGAVTFTNPAEVIKTRMQLQGELTEAGKATRIYKGTIQGLGLVLRREGFRGIQKGLFPGYIYQTCLNGARLGFYEPLRHQFNTFLGYEASKQVMAINVISGALSGATGAALGSPFYLIKTRMQSYSPEFRVGSQTYYKSIWQGLSTIFRAEGVRGLYRGVDAAIFRTSCGSSVQLPIYNWAKSVLSKHQIVEDGPRMHLMASAVSGFGVCIAMNPGDVLMTRMYNQKGNKYKNPLDCFFKTISIEGPLALYKGFGPHLMRILPHTVLTLTFMEQTMKLAKRIEGVPL